MINTVRYYSTELAPDMEEEEEEYNKAVASTWSVGDKEVLYDPIVKPHSNQVSTKKNFKGPYVIVDIVQGKTDIRPAY